MYDIQASSYICIIYIASYLLALNVPASSYRTVGNFCGSNFCGSGSSYDFVGLYFCGVPALITYLYS